MVKLGRPFRAPPLGPQRQNNPASSVTWVTDLGIYPRESTSGTKYRSVQVALVIKRSGITKTVSCTMVTGSGVVTYTKTFTATLVRRKTVTKTVTVSLYAEKRSMDRSPLGMGGRSRYA